MVPRVACASSSCRIDEGLGLSADDLVQGTAWCPDVESASDTRLGDPNSVWQSENNGSFRWSIVYIFSVPSHAQLLQRRCSHFTKNPDAYSKKLALYIESGVSGLTEESKQFLKIYVSSL